MAKPYVSIRAVLVLAIVAGGQPSPNCAGLEMC